MAKALSGPDRARRVREADARHLRCVLCSGPLELEVLHGSIHEGFLSCGPCGRAYPVAEGVPVMWRSFAEYIRARPSLGGRLMLGARTPAMKKFVKESLRGPPAPPDRAPAEARWARIYSASRRGALYREAARALAGLPGDVVEYGCSVGAVSGRLEGRAAFGTDRSFHAVLEASKKSGVYAVADSLEHPFGKRRFGVAACFNMLESAGPRALLPAMAGQAGALVISSPYDYAPGTERCDPQSLRAALRAMGFSVPAAYGEPRRIPWTLRLGPRARLCYEADLVVAERMGLAGFEPAAPSTRN